MSQTSKQDLEKFAQELQQAYERVGNGKIHVDSNLVRAVVRLNKDTAYHYVELIITMAASQPGYLNEALLVASAYQVEFADNTLLNLVHNRAKELKAMDQMNIDIASNPQEMQAPNIPIQALEVEPADLANCDIVPFINHFSLVNIEASGKFREIKSLRGKCAITFPLDDDPRSVIQIPSSRKFTQALHETLPHLPYFLTPIPELGALHAYFGCLIDERFVTGNAIDVEPESFIPILLQCAEGITALCKLINDDAHTACNDAFSIFPEEIRNLVMHLKGI